MMKLSRMTMNKFIGLASCSLLRDLSLPMQDSRDFGLSIVFVALVVVALNYLHLNNCPWMFCFCRHYDEGPNCFLSDMLSRNFDFNTERDDDSEVWEYRSSKCDNDRAGENE